MKHFGTSNNGDNLFVVSEYDIAMIERAFTALYNQTVSNVALSENDKARCIDAMTNFMHGVRGLN